jgi:hypothetical protein
MSDQILYTLHTSLHELSRFKSRPHLDHRKITSLKHPTRTPRSTQLPQNGKSARVAKSQLTNPQKAGMNQYLRTQRTNPIQD